MKSAAKLVTTTVTEIRLGSTDSGCHTRVRLPASCSAEMPEEKIRKRKKKDEARSVRFGSPVFDFFIAVVPISALVLVHLPTFNTRPSGGDVQSETLDVGIGGVSLLGVGGFRLLRDKSTTAYAQKHPSVDVLRFSVYTREGSRGAWGKLCGTPLPSPLGHTCTIIYGTNHPVR